MRNKAFIIAIIPFIAVACGNKTKERHLEKFLDPTRVQNEAPLEPIDSTALPSDPSIQQRVNTIDFPEAARRLGAHRYTANIRFSTKQGGTEATVSESAKIELARNADFRTTVENDAGLGYELVFSNGHYYIRNRYGVFHEDETLSDAHLRLRDSAYGGWAAIYRLYRGRLSFQRQASISRSGRSMMRFSVGLSASAPSLPGTAAQPSVPAGVTKYVYPIKPTLADKDAWRDHLTPVAANGTILVDAATGVLVNVEFDGSLAFSTPSRSGGSLIISARINSDNFGGAPSIAAPSPDQLKPMPQRLDVDTHPLDFFYGKGFTATLGPPAGVAAKADKQSPDTKSPSDSESGGPE